MTNIINNGGTFEPIDLIVIPSHNQLCNGDDISRVNPHILEFKIDSPYKSM